MFTLLCRAAQYLANAVTVYYAKCGVPDAGQFCYTILNHWKGAGVVDRACLENRYSG